MHKVALYLDDLAMHCMGRIRPGRMGLRLVKAKERGVRRNTCALGIKCVGR